ncbi:MAG: RsmB/NOP family class I SAM-dependent RNA methyltransferase, partial [Erysipelotrichaceae bacterium]|nr:RsmB/NOP family class I SAM-dependent RNA methyltransferase [Erysipelotrichaceae bacterium]
MSINNQLFIKQCQKYFEDDCERFLEKLEEPCSQAFFLNTRKADKEEILKLIDFDYKESPLTDQSFYHNCDNIGKTKAYELGLIYPQEIAASLSSLFIDGKDVRRIVDLCAAPGGKTINALNRTGKDVLCISNDVNHTRALTLSSNLERLGLDNVIITNKKTEELARQLEGFADLVILDAPCSGEGMIRKYPEILDEYSLNNIKQLSSTQSKLLDEAYRILNNEGQILYSTCTYAFEEDEKQISDFLERYPDMELIPIDLRSSSKLKGTVKLSPLNATEGQFIALMNKGGNKKEVSIKNLKPVREKLVDDFIKDNLILDEYYLYKNNDRFFLSLRPLPDLGYNALKYGIYLGEIINRR